ncbi:MAG TPA: tyrosine-type recombinase/integrase [Candidatus Udaeobacter sp.]|nr:tyrosine-type recombinase/integrase [Candidatus Udaeobacter sp.]
MTVLTQAGTAVDDRPKNFLTDAEITSFLKAARKGRHGIRNHAMVLLAYRHGLRVSELINIRMADVDLDTGHLFVRRLKGSLSTSHPLEGDEIRTMRAWLRQRIKAPCCNSPLVFLSERGPMTRQAFNYVCAEIGRRAGLNLKVHPHMLRHSCGFALANKGRDTRLIQDYLGHRNITHTQIYTRTARIRFEGLWR